MMHKRTGFLLLIYWIHSVSFLMFVSSSPYLSFNLGPLVSASVISIPQDFRGMDCLLRSPPNAYNSRLMNVFKEEVYCVDGPIIEVIEFLLKFFFQKKYNRCTFWKNSGEILPEVLWRAHCEVSLFLLFLWLEVVETWKDSRELLRIAIIKSWKLKACIKKCSKDFLFCISQILY